MNEQYAAIREQANHYGDGCTGIELVRVEQGKPVLPSFWIREDEVHLFDTREGGSKPLVGLRRKEK